jgi:hypothetical protein
MTKSNKGVFVLTQEYRVTDPDFEKAIDAEVRAEAKILPKNDPAEGKVVKTPKP